MDAAGYWAWNNGVFVFNAGYWGPTVGFYGGINYGFGYTGDGLSAATGRINVFVYNRAVNNFGNVEHRDRLQPAGLQLGDDHA